MSKSNELLNQGKVKVICVESINNHIAFVDPKAKSFYLELLAQAAKSHPANKILAYAVLRENAYIMVYTIDESQMNKMMIKINETYANYYNERFNYNGYVFRLPNQITNINSDGIIGALAHIHKLPEYKNVTKNYRKYKFSSCYPIFKKMQDIVDREFLLNLLGFDKLDGITYTSWHQQALKSSFKKERRGLESYRKALETCTLRYRGNNLVTDENAIKQIIMDVSERSNVRYSKLAKKMGISRRRDILIEVIASMVFDRGYTYLDAINILQAYEYGVFTLLMEVILSVNAINQFGYDYMINKLAVDDYDYNILVEIIKTLNKQYGMGFVEIAERFHLQNNIIQIRVRTGI